mgnify:CR=1 FL=1
MQSKASSVAEYLASLPPDRRQCLEALRAVILQHLDAGFEEGMQYGMIGYYVPHRVYPAGYHCDPRQPLPYAALASQKQHMSLYLMGLYAGPSIDGQADNAETIWFRQAWAASGKKLDLGKSCLRFKRLDDLALEVIAEAFRRLPASEYIARVEAGLAASKAAKRK